MPEATRPDPVALHRLCAAYGIATTYEDVWGRRVDVAESSLVALLAEFGVDAASPGAIATAERELERAAEPAALPPVAAIRAGAARWSVPLPRSHRAPRLKWRVTEEGGARHEGIADAAASLEVALVLPPGYHRLAVEGLAGETLLLSAPARCYRPPALADGARIWGPTAQLYTLRSQRNWGMGDFGDLARLAEQAAAMGAGIVGVNPLHALFPHNPAHASPYSPSSRRWLNVLYLDVEAIPDFRECAAARRRVRSAPFQARLARLRGTDLVDYPGVAAAKFEILELLYAHFRERHLAAGSARAAAFRAFQDHGGSSLRQHATYEALQAKFHAADPSVWGWPAWPVDFRDPQSGAVAAFAGSSLERIEYYEYLQWQAALQLDRVGERCRTLGLAVGLYLDLAVSVDRAGSDAWTWQSGFARAASVGAPPDAFNLNGQDWGLPPLRPDRLRTDRYRFFIETLRENMQGAGALRIDHVLGLMRLFWIPAGHGARDGAYVHYPLEELLAVVAIESGRNRCMVVGEDLGTIAAELRASLQRRGVLSTRLLYFERGEGGAFRPGGEYPRDALVAVSTHDLPTLAGWWAGRDLAVRRELNLLPDHETWRKQVAERAQDRAHLTRALADAGLLPEGMAADAGQPKSPDPELAEAIHAFVAASPSQLMAVQLEDLAGVADQVNLPGTTDQHPNWRRKLPEDLDRIVAGGRVRSLAARLNGIRPNPSPRGATMPAVQEARIPRATYRLQFHKDFGFDAAVAILPYLARLGISHVYCSPVLRARPGSLHGYDIVAHGEISHELGGEAGFARFSQALRDLGMGQLLDMVPNHMGVLGADNAWWMDVLENGPASPHAQAFDIDWHPVNADLDGKVLVPALGDHYGNVLAGGELMLVFERDTGGFALRYHEHRLPLDPGTYPAVLERAAALLTTSGAGDEVAGLATAFGQLPRRDDARDEARALRARDKEILKARLAGLAARNDAVERAIDVALAGFNASGAHDAMHDLLERQAYRLAYWRVASDEINYRRFFDINDLAALRMENEQVFEDTHALVLDLAASGVVDGLRIDHPDGLYDPAQYFRRLQEGFARRAGIAPPGPEAGGRPARPLYVVAEKIVAPHEDVPESWHVHGTTGYRFAMVAGGVLTDTAARGRIDRTWRAFTGEEAGFEELAYQGRRAIMRSALASELTMLATELLRIARADRRTRDYTFNTLRQALAEVAACLPVYRTYIVESASAQDLRYVDWAVAHARRRSRAADVSIFDFVRVSVLGEAIPDATAELRERARRFALRFQQFTSPVAAKGVEDTAFYRYGRLASLNEVGGDPSQFGVTLRAFHGASADRARRWPHTLLATSTHDSKRSEDVRNRISVLTELPAAWRLFLRRWRRLGGAHRGRPENGGAPSPADEYLLYQTLLGTAPGRDLDEAALADWRGRIERYAVKAAREAKTHTSWISPDERYEQGLAGFVRALLARPHPNPFLEDLLAQAAVLGRFGAYNSLALAAIKFTSPGVPDLYQGNELMDFSLVDPDNRRPVEYARRMRLLDELESMAQAPDLAARVAALLHAPEDGRAKLWVTRRLLALRNRLPDLFSRGGYRALSASGSAADKVVAYRRAHGAHALVFVTGRFYAKLLGASGQLPVGEAWGDTRIAVPGLADGTRLTDALTGARFVLSGGGLALREVLAAFPVAALLAGEDAPPR